MTNPHDAHPVVVPPFEGRATRVVVALHGRTQDTDFILGVTARVGLRDTKVVAVQAAGNTWYPKSFLVPLEENEPALTASLLRVHAVILAEKQAGFALDRIVLLGFSQGACLLSEYVRRNPRRYAALIAFTGGVLGPEGSRLEPTGSLHGLPVLVTNGDQDPWVPLWRSRETAALFRAMGAAVDEHVFAGREHVVLDEETALARALLTRPSAPRDPE